MSMIFLTSFFPFLFVLSYPSLVPFTAGSFASPATSHYLLRVRRGRGVEWTHDCYHFPFFFSSWFLFSPTGRPEGIPPRPKRYTCGGWPEAGRRAFEDGAGSCCRPDCPASPGSRPAVSNYALNCRFSSFRNNEHLYYLSLKPNN